MIHLNTTNKHWIKACKGHYNDKYPQLGDWHLTLKPLFAEIYGYEPDERYQEYLRCLFDSLYETLMLITEDKDRVTKSILNSSFGKTICCDAELPIERAIHTICGHIFNTRVLDDNKELRFNIDV